MKGRVIPKLPLEERLFWAGAPFTPKEDMALLARDEEVRMVLAKNPACPREILEELAQRCLEDVEEELAENPSAPPTLLERIYRRARGGRRWLLLPLAKNPSTPGHILEEVVWKDRKCEEAVAENPSTPPELLRKLFWRDSSLDYHLIENPSLPLDLLLLLMKESRYAWKAGGNPSLPEEHLRRLARSEDWRARAGVGKNPKAPRDLLEALAEDPEDGVRMKVAINPSCPKEILAKLAKDVHEDVRLAVARNPACPLEVLKELDWNEALLNPGLSLEGFVELVVARFERRGWLSDHEAYKLLPLLDLLPKDPMLWFNIWVNLEEPERRIFDEHPDGRGLRLLGALGA